MTARDVLDLAHAHCHYRQSVDVLEYWAGRQADGDRPEPPEFDPLDVPALLPHLYLLERHDGRLRYRVSGEAVNSLFGSQHTGRYLDQVVPPAVYAIVSPYFERVFDGTICLFKGNVVLPTRDFLSFERVLMPVIRQGRLLLLGCLSLSSTAQRRDDPPGPLPDGFHFLVHDIARGTTATHYVPVTAETFRRPDTGHCA
jgi:hypothetical protein